LLRLLDAHPLQWNADNRLVGGFHIPNAKRSGEQGRGERPTLGDTGISSAAATIAPIEEYSIGRVLDWL